MCNISLWICTPKPYWVMAGPMGVRVHLCSLWAFVTGSHLLWLVTEGLSFLPGGWVADKCAVIPIQYPSNIRFWGG